MRLEILRQKMKAAGLTAFLVTDMKNIYWLTGFSGTAGVVLVTTDSGILLTDSRYTGVARAILSSDWELLETREVFSELTRILSADTILGFEDTLDFAAFKGLQRLSIGQLRDTHLFIGELRQVKNEDEISKIRKACLITEEAFSASLSFIRPGVEEIEVANFLDFRMRELGASGLSFETIVASGKRSALPHGVATHKVIAFGEAVTLDFGCFYEHYASDMTRTIFVGKADAKLAEIYEIVQEANCTLIEKAKAGLSLADYDGIPRKVIDKAGYGAQFTHGIGHGVGLDIHELPYFGPNLSDQLQENMVVTDEPGIYLSESGGVRIEDTLLIQADGCELLTQAPKELIIL